MSASGKRALVCYTSSERPPLRGWTGWMTKQPFKNLSEDLSPRTGSFVAKLFGKWKVSVQLQIFGSLLASIWNLQSLVFLTLFFFFFFCSTFFLWKKLLVSCAGGMVVANGVFNLPVMEGEVTPLPSCAFPALIQSGRPGVKHEHEVQHKHEM